MSKTIPVSVIIPTYNYAHYLTRAVESVLAQTCPVAEIVVLDDGSTDNTREVAAGFGDRIRYIHQENRGLSATRNAASRAATGEWIGLLDSDDAWFPEKNAKVQELLRQHPDASFIYHPSIMLFPDGSQKIKRTLDPEALWPEMRYGNHISGGSCALIRRSVLLELGGFNESIITVEDWDLWVRIAARYPLHRINEPLTWQYMHPDSLGSKREMLMNIALGLTDRSLVAGLTGINKKIYSQRIRSHIYYDASLDTRSSDSALSRRYLRQSLMQWPSPFFLPKRWWALALTIAGRL